MSFPLRHAFAFLALTTSFLSRSQPASAQTSGFVESFYQGVNIRNNYTGFVGMKFTVGSSPIWVTELGRYSIASVTQPHTLKLVTAQFGMDVPNGSVTLAPQAVTTGTVLNVALPQPLLLQPNQSYFLVSQETAGGDSWYDYTPVSTTNVAALTAAVYQDASGAYVPVSNSVGKSYVPVDFVYSLTEPGPAISITSPIAGDTYTGVMVTYSATVTPGTGLSVASVQFQVGSGGTLTNYGPAQTQTPYTTQESTSSLTPGLNTLQVVATDSAGAVSTASVPFYVGQIGSGGGPLISGFSATNTRNNYGGFVGLEFTVGASPLTVTSLGRIALPNNSQTHTLKLVNAQTSQDVPGGTVSLAMTPGNGTAFEYAALASPINLAANTSFLLLSSETSGGDTWYDYSPVTSGTTGANIAGAVYSNVYGAYVVVPNTAHYSYVPVNLTTSGGEVPGSINIASPANNSIFGIGSITFSANFTPAVPNTAASVQFVLNGQNYGAPITTPPYSLQVDSGLLAITNGATDTLSAIGTDSAGNLVSSSKVSFTVGNEILPFLQQSTSLADTYGGEMNGQYFGMQFTVGSSPLRVVALGQFVNSLVNYHFVTFVAPMKLVDAATGLDIPGGAATLTIAGPSLGYVYASLPAPVTLQENKAYYLVTTNSYVNGPAPLITPGAGTLNYAVVQNGGYLVITSLPGVSEAPLSFEYDASTLVPPVASISSPAQNSTLTGLVPIVIQVNEASDLPTTVQLQLDGKNVGPVLNATYQSQYSSYAAEYSLDSTALSNGAHVLTAIATDALAAQSTSAAVIVTVNNTASTGSSLPAFVTSFSPTFLRNNYSGYLGMKVTVGSVPIEISSLGRVCVAGNSASHTVKLVQASNGSDLPGGSATVSMGGCAAGQFVYSALTSPVILTAASSYYLVDQETLGGDQWYDYSPIVTASGATVNGPVYANGSQYVTVGAAASSYVPLNFLFSSAPAIANPGFAVTLSANAPYVATVTSNLPVVSVQFMVDGYSFGAPITSAPYNFPTTPVPNLGSHAIVAVAKDSAGNTAASPAVYETFGGLLDVINFTGTNLRNNYSGWVGFRLTTGSTPHLVTGPVPSQFSLGRLCYAGNSMVHVVKLVNASTGIDVPNAVGWINMSGCAVGTYLDADLAGVTLAANTSYYVVSQEVNGGDQWYDISPALPLASVSIPVPPPSAEIGLVALPTGASFTIDGPVYSAADGSLVFVPSPNHSYLGLSVGGTSILNCPGIDNCPPS